MVGGAIGVDRVQSPLSFWLEGVCVVVKHVRFIRVDMPQSSIHHVFRHRQICQAMVHVATPAIKDVAVSQFPLVFKDQIEVIIPCIGEIIRAELDRVDGSFLVVGV